MSNFTLFLLVRMFLLCKIINMKIRYTGNGKIPEYKTVGAAGADIYACISNDTENSVTIKPGKVGMIPTGLFFEIPEGYEIQIRPRSGLAAKESVTVLNTPGTIDSDFRGEVKVILINLGDKDFIVRDGDRIAQMVYSPVIQAEFEKVETLSETERGSGGFGHTGK